MSIPRCRSAAQQTRSQLTSAFSLPAGSARGTSFWPWARAATRCHSLLRRTVTQLTKYGTTERIKDSREPNRPRRRHRLLQLAVATFGKHIGVAGCRALCDERAADVAHQKPQMPLLHDVEPTENCAAWDRV
jgi:hypothetical protein